MEDSRSLSKLTGRLFTRTKQSAFTILTLSFHVLGEMSEAFYNTYHNSVVRYS